METNKVISWIVILLLIMGVGYLFIDYQGFKSTYKQKVISSLNSCESIESESSSSSISCNEVCSNQGKICIKEDVADWDNTIKRWIVDTRNSCKTYYSPTKNEAVAGGFRLQCICCSSS